MTYMMEVMYDFHQIEYAIKSKEGNFGIIARITLIQCTFFSSYINHPYWYQEHYFTF